MTDDRISPSAAHDLLVQADPVPRLPDPDLDNVARVVRAARAADDPTRPTARRVRPGAPRRRRQAVALAGVGVAVAAAVVAVVEVHGTDDTGPARPPVAVEAPPTARTSAPVTTAPPTVTTAPPTSSAPPVTDPVVFLHTAASVSAAAPFTPPRPDQFLYVHEDNGYEAWVSMDGTHDGLIVPNGTTDRIPVPGCRNGVTTEVGNGPTVTSPCTPEPAYRPDIPSEPAALEQWLVEHGGGAATNNVAKEVLGTLEFDYLTPATRGALYTVLAGYDGLTVADIPADPDAVGVTWSYGGGSVTLVFGRADHTYRGILTDDGGGIDGSTSVVVDAVGQTG